MVAISGSLDMVVSILPFGVERNGKGFQKNGAD